MIKIKLRKSQPTKLSVFDFDHTLFKSPEPPKGYSGNWHIKKDSLSPPAVPEVPGTEFWNLDVVTAAKKELASNHSYTILLTGRVDKFFRDRIEQLLSQQNLNFKQVGLNSFGGDTVDFKVAEIKKVLSKYPSIKNIEMWDDDEEKIRKYQEIFGNKVKINHVGKKESLTEETFSDEQHNFMSNLSFIERTHFFDNIPFETVKKNLSQIPALKKWSIIKVLGQGAKGIAFLLNNDHTLKIGENRAEDSTRYKHLYDKVFSGMGSKNDLMIYDYGTVGDKEKFLFAEMSKIVVYGDYLKSAQLINKAEYIVDMYAFYLNSFLFNTYRDNLLKNKLSSESYFIRVATQGKLNQGPIPREHQLGILKAMYKLYKATGDIWKDRHMYNIGILEQSGKNPTFVIFDT